MLISTQTKGSTPTNRAERRRAKHGLQLRPKLISIDAGCDYSGLGRSKFYEDVIPKVDTVKIGNRRLVVLDSLDEFLDRLLAAAEDTPDNEIRSDEDPRQEVCDEEVGPMTRGRQKSRKLRCAVQAP